MFCYRTKRDIYKNKVSFLKYQGNKSKKPFWWFVEIEGENEIKYTELSVQYLNSKKIKKKQNREEFSPRKGQEKYVKQAENMSKKNVIF